ncbi:hypothetical protein [Streptomyces roseolilacinus]|uniref:hypothetical protein n=1 Tax=Streptomyces roseolilacinus TaxID=66904 RepID=UPI00381D52DC
MRLSFERWCTPSCCIGAGTCFLHDVRELGIDTSSTQSANPTEQATNLSAEPLGDQQDDAWPDENLKEVQDKTGYIN